MPTPDAASAPSADDDAGGGSPPGPSVRLRVGVGAGIVLVVLALVVSVLVTAISPVGATTVFGDGDPPTMGAAMHSSSPRGGAAGASGAAGSADAAGSANAAGSSGSAQSSARSDSAPVGASGATVMVHVLGAVRVTGVYQVDEGARVIDAITAAGGLADGADQASVNLARAVVDGEQIRVLAVGEAPPMPAAGAGPVHPAEGSSAASGGGSGAGASGAGGALINLNAATALDLDALPRIGPAMAQRIIDWREANGPFASVDELGEVSGIGDKTMESLRPLVTI